MFLDQIIYMQSLKALSMQDYLPANVRQSLPIAKSSNLYENLPVQTKMAFLSFREKCIHEYVQFLQLSSHNV